MAKGSSLTVRSLSAFLLLGLLIGSLLGLGWPASPKVTSGLTIPFWALLGSMAIFPLFAPHFWHKHFGSIAMLFAGVAAALMVGQLPPADALRKLSHAGLEYLSFIALVGGLYVVSGSIVVKVRGHGSSLAITSLLGLGAVLANLIGTTGASMLLLRPFLKLIGPRRKALHVVYFIFIVSNCGGALTPIGDPPLYLGYLAGVPFFWTATTLFQDWLFVIGALLSTFFLVDRLILARNAPPQEQHTHLDSAGVEGRLGIISLFVMVAAIFIDPALRSTGMTTPIPLGPLVQLSTALYCYRKSPRALYARNEFSFFPAQEVGLLFFAIFITMQPALAYLALHGASLGLSSPHSFALATGVLSAILDNAPTYVSMLQVAYSGAGLGELSPLGVKAFALSADGGPLLRAISIGAVFFGAMTYIGNGPNFMVKAIAESSGVKMPSFFGYLGWACVLLLPILLVHVWVYF